MIEIKKFRLLIAFISLLVCMSFIKETYAKYVTNVDGQASMAIARWRILVNNSDITNGSLASSTITPVFSGNSNIAPDVVAPTSTGYFDIIIDSNGTDVSFNYTINTTVNTDSGVSDLVTTGYSINGGPTTNFINYNESITGSIAYGTTTPTTIRVYVLWNDATDATMNNQSDTNASVSQSDPILDVALSFIQNH